MWEERFLSPSRDRNRGKSNDLFALVLQPTYEMGKAAVGLLLQSILSTKAHGDQGSQQILLNSTLRVRESTAVATG